MSESQSMPCPFQVGDIIHEVGPVVTELPSRPMSGKSSCIQATLDESRPNVVVTAITERGFIYEYDHPVPFGRAQWGEMMTGGECFEGGFGRWRKVG